MYPKGYTGGLPLCPLIFSWLRSVSVVIIQSYELSIGISISTDLWLETGLVFAFWSPFVRNEIVEYCLSCEGLDSHSERSHIILLLYFHRVKTGLSDSYGSPVR